MGAEGELLVDHGQAAGARVGRASGAPGLAVEGHAPAVGRLDAGEDLHERALAGAVLSEDRMHLARASLELDAAEGDGQAERLAEVAEYDAA